jgi:hypothetical protein
MDKVVENCLQRALQYVLHILSDSTKFVFMSAVSYNVAVTFETILVKFFIAQATSNNIVLELSFPTYDETKSQDHRP